MSNSTSANKIPDDTWSYSVETNIENSEIHSYFSTVQASTNKGTAGQRRTCYMHKRVRKKVYAKATNVVGSKREKPTMRTMNYQRILREEMTLPASENSKKKNQRQDGFWKSISEKFMSYQNNISKTRRIITLLGNFRLDTRESPWMQSFPRTKLTKLHKILLIMSNGLHNLFLNTFKNISILITIHLRLRGLKTIQRLKTST
ncbi:uncharacterized protein OCT59_025828 [Rhizophagus irregularis]|uniref:uncharacterized protein n=1 Tax=Rhizophagus irregularis TaxID=588596 RepID=UPI0033189420|nr:hypothetical protein OCT59_025828 [Rhizophagus irregularis]